MSHKVEDTDKTKVFIVGSYPKSKPRHIFEQLLEETYLLAKTAGLTVVGEFTQGLSNNKSDTYVGKGKLDEIKNECSAQDIKTLIFVDNLTSAQAKSISKTTETTIVDRTELILGIFAKHARSNVARIQVELAQLEYSYSKLRNLWEHLSRIAGGLGTKGPGEKQLEIDRRQVQDRIKFLQNKIKKFQTTGSIQRKNRNDFYKIAIVGYTNAGKSTLFNTLTKSDNYVADELFATLDSKARLLFNESGKVIITDTVGFISNLPTILISSFHSTLTDVIDADLLLHVIDASALGVDDKIKDVDNIISEIGAGQIPVVMVFNKIDKIDSDSTMFLKKNMRYKYPKSIFISAKDKTNIDTINNFIKKVLDRGETETIISIPAEMNSLIRFLDKKYKVIDKSYQSENNSFMYNLVIQEDELLGIGRQVEKFKELQFINSKL